MNRRSRAPLVALLTLIFLTPGGGAIPEFPAPSTGGAPSSGSYVTLSTEAELGSSRRLVNGLNTVVNTSVAGEIAIDSTAGSGAELPTTSFSGTGTAAVGFNFADASGGSYNLLLPTAVGNTGKLLEVKKTDTSGNTVTLIPTGIQTIDGASAYVLSSANQVLAVISDGSNWRVR